MKKAAARLNLSAHRAGRPNTAGVMVWSAVDLEGHLGEDGRFYMLDFSRVFPPRRPDMSQKNCHLFHMLRPGLVVSGTLELSTSNETAACLL
jgi:Clustered mitochondria